MSDEIKVRFGRPNVPSFGLVLYYHPHNFYSQKILIALFEKRIPFHAQVVDLMRGEQYSPWFLELNPRGEVPVLQNGVQIIPESNRILAYLEDHFSDDKTPSLIPTTVKRDILVKIVYFNRQISRLPISAISIGVFMHPDMRENAKHPMKTVTLESILRANQTASEVLHSYAQIDALHAEALITRSALQLKKIYAMENRTEFLELMAKVIDILNEVEDQLAKRQFDVNDTQWLCCDTFSVADLSLTVLLHRLSTLGLESMCWKPNRPLTAKYYDRVCERESFRRSLPPAPTMQKRLAFLVHQLSPMQLALSVLTAAIVAVPLLSMMATK